MAHVATASDNYEVQIIHPGAGRLGPNPLLYRTTEHYKAPGATFLALAERRDANVPDQKFVGNSSAWAAGRLRR